MSGTVHGKIECVGVNTAAAGARDMFATVVLFFDAVFTRIASHAGASPTGTASLALPGVTGSANASGENAWGVWRWDKPDGSKVYIYMTWCWSNNFNTGGAVPTGGGIATFGVGIQFAQRSDNGNPWAGTTNNNGADTKANPVWTAGGGGASLCVWPRANGPGGSGATALSYVQPFAAFVTIVTGWRLQCLKDDDSLVLLFDNGGTGGYDGVTFFTRYTVHAGITPTFPLMCHACMIATGAETTNIIPGGATIGLTTGNSAVEGGAVVHAADGVRSFFMQCLAGLNTSTLQPNGYTSGYDYHDIWLIMNDATAPAKTGLIGKIDSSLLAAVPNLPVHSTDTAKTRAAFGSATLLHYKFVTRWDGTTTPGSGNTLAGITF